MPERKAWQSQARSNVSTVGPEDNRQMEIVTSLEVLNSEKSTVVTIGKFDGLHRGHRELIRLTAECGRDAGLKSVVFSFDMTPSMLLSERERAMMLEREGIDLLVKCDFGPEIITMTADEFVRDILLEKLKMKTIVVGEHFRFGYERRGDVAFLQKMGADCGFSVIPVPEVMDGDRKVSSSDIRRELASGNIEKVNELLGYPFFLTGRIIHGRQIGRTIGVPTANLITDRSKLLPPNGVYFSRNHIGDGSSWNGITNIGTKPTVDGHFVGVETYLFSCEDDLYGEKLRVELLHFSRPEKKFSSLEELKGQIEKDEREGKKYFGDIPE